MILTHIDKGGSAMPSNKAGYDIAYAKKNLKRVPLDIRRDFYESVMCKLPELTGSSINGFIKAAITEKIQRDGLDLPIDEYKP